MFRLILKGSIILLLMIGVPFAIFFFVLGSDRMPGLDVAIMLVGFYVFLLGAGVGMRFVINNALIRTKPLNSDWENTRSIGKWKFLAAIGRRVAIPAAMAITLGFFAPVYFLGRDMTNAFLGYVVVLVVVLGGAVLISSAIWERREREFVAEAKKNTADKDAPAKEPTL